MTGTVSVLDDISVVERFALQSRQLGYAGSMVIHPSHVEVMNRAFAPSEAEIREAEAVVAALEAAELRGDQAVALGGRMVDTAMLASARLLLDEARRLSGGRS